MKLYINKKAIFESDILEIEIEDSFTKQGKRYYNVGCYFIRNHTAPNGEEFTKCCVGSVFFKNELKKDYLIPYFEKLICQIEDHGKT